MSLRYLRKTWRQGAQSLWLDAASRRLPARPPQRPIFVIGCPRSGTTLLFHMIAASPLVRSLGKEGHVIWERHHHPRRKGWESNALDETDITRHSRDFIYRSFAHCFGAARAVEKTPKNCLRLRFLNALFPDASFVLLRRDGRDNVNSLIEVWKLPDRHMTYRVPVPLRLDGRLVPYWHCVLPPGWRRHTEGTLEDLCAFQWIACNERILRDSAAIAAERCYSLRFEDLLADSVGELTKLFGFLQLPVDEAVVACAKALRPVSTITPPKKDKWKTQNPEKIERILPQIAPMMRRLGYTPGGA